MEPHGHAFGRAYRLTDSDAYELVFKNGQRARSRCFKGLSRNNNGTHPRLGLAISKRVAKRAVDRNRLKRLIRDYFRMHRETIANRDYVILANDGAPGYSKAELVQSLEDLFDKLSAEINNRGPNEMKENPGG